MKQMHESKADANDRRMIPYTEDYSAGKAAGLSPQEMKVADSSRTPALTVGFGGPGIVPTGKPSLSNCHLHMHLSSLSYYP